MTVDSRCPLTCPHGSPATCQLLNPPSSLRQIAPVRSGKGLLHHFNCCAVCVHQGNSRDSKLNSDMQFIQERRPIERLSAEPPPPTLEAEICCCQWCRAPCLSPGTEAPGDRMLPGPLASCIPILQKGSLSQREGSYTWEQAWGPQGQGGHGFVCDWELCTTGYPPGTPRDDKGAHQSRSKAVGISF